jgi:N-acyl-phosphatidylethanolamine-hydrolysing phospholipase D
VTAQRRTEKPDHHAPQGFSNPFPEYRHKSISSILRWVFMDRRRGQRIKKRADYVLEQVENDGAWLRENSTEFTVTWVGHSTVLLQIDGINILTDPIWSNRASPVSFAGPKRYIEPGIALEDLPDIHVVLLSHNHYDHFDRATLRRLKESVFIVPLGFGRTLRRLGVTHYHELDWWQAISYRGMTFTCTPAQHGSARSIHDRNKTLWCSWSVKGRGNNVFFCGDTGYFPGFTEIGDRLGPFDLVCLPIGAYLPRDVLEHVHMGPEEAVQAYQDLRGGIFVAIHWGTFNLGNDPPDMAPKVLLDEIGKADLDHELFWPLKHGETRLIRPARRAWM